MVTVTVQTDGVAILSAPLEKTASGLISWMAKRMGQPLTKSFELEPVGAFVWELCDGKNSVSQISLKLRERYKMTRVESDAALTAFLQTLSERRLVSLKVAKMP